MEYLIKSIRERFYGRKYAEEPGSTGETKIPLQKKQSFKGEKKRPQNWLQRQFSRQMSQDYDSGGIEQATAVAAAAYAITSMKESSIRDEKKIGEGLEAALPRIKSKKKDAASSFPEPHRLPKQFSGEGLIRSPESPDGKMPESGAADSRTPVKVVGPTPSIKKTPTFTDKPAPSMKKTLTSADKPLNGTKDIKTQSIEPKTDLPAPATEIEVPKPDLPSTSKPATPPTKTKRQDSTRPGIEETKAEDWERAELAKIKTRYDLLNEQILSWENKKKAKARHRLDKKESKMERMRLNALEQFHSEMNDINQIASGARSKAAERQRNEELKAQEKANKIRKTGKVPRTCFCF